MSKITCGILVSELQRNDILTFRSSRISLKSSSVRYLNACSNGSRAIPKRGDYTVLFTPGGTCVECLAVEVVLVEKIAEICVHLT